MYRRLGLPVSRRFFSSHSATSSAEDHIHRTFAAVHAKSLPENEKTYYTLIQHLVINEYAKAKERTKEQSKLFDLINGLPRANSPTENLKILSKYLSENPAKPVMTSHPTRVLSNAAVTRLFNLVDAALKYEACPDRLEMKRLDEALHELLIHPVRQTRHLTPQEEAKYGLFIYQKILESFPGFLKQVTDYFLKIHGGSHHEVARELKSALMPSYQPYSWIPGDADGNYNVTAETMKEIVPARQIAILELYNEKLAHLLFLADKQSSDIALLQTLKKNLKDTIEHFENCIKAIRAGIWFDEVGSNTKINEVKKIFTHATAALDTGLATALSEFITLVEIAGFFGGTKEYVRQTTFVNRVVFNELLQILNDSEKNDIYDTFSEPEKKQFHQLLSRDPAYFSKIKAQQEQLSPTARRELQRLAFILKHRDIFPFYICSDTKSKLNFDEVRILMHLAAFLEGNLCIGQMKRFPVNFLFLCETPEDIQHFSIILGEILEDPWMRARIIDAGFISYVSGPSDLGKTGGIATHLALCHAQQMAQNCLDDFKKKYPQLKAVKLHVLHGYGGDMKRRIKRAGELTHATFQGLDAYDELGAPGAYSAYLHRTVGRPSMSCSRVEEFQRLQSDAPEAFEVLHQLESLGVEGFQSFFETDAAKNLLRSLTHPTLERAMNVSSRAGSKKSTADITQVRAIGLVNLYLLTGVQWDIFMSVVGWTRLPVSTYPLLPVLYAHSIVVRDVVDKVLFAIAVSDMPRAWQKIQNGLPVFDEVSAWSALYQSGAVALENHHTLAYLETSARDILSVLIQFMPEKIQSSMQQKLQKSYQQGRPLHELALSLIKLMPKGSAFYEETVRLRARHALLNACVDAYEQDKDAPYAVTNVVLACRAIGIAKGPDYIANTSEISKSCAYDATHEYVPPFYGL